MVGSTSLALDDIMVKAFQHPNLNIVN
uniref:Uncharacterized protein n=1 Tax=Arundo donax TaxID=35708 RepID=A0A0A9H787_ARUDO